MKKTMIAVMMALLVLTTVFAGAQGEKAVAQKTFKIGFATIFEGETWETQKKYLDEEVGPALNMTFMYSEKLADANGLVDFMEKAYAAGCDGVINTVTSNDAVALGARKAEEWGIWFVTQNSVLNKDVATLSHNMGHIGASADGMNVAYKKAFDNLLADGKNHSVYIFSGAAVGGAIGQGAASHYYSVYGILQAMQDKYGLKYEKTIDAIINNQNPGEVATGNPNVKIYIYAGFADIPGAIKSVQTQLQTGPYDIFAAVASYSMFTNAIDAVEKSTGKNVKIVGTASIESQTKTGFETLDSTGDTVLNIGIVNPLCPADGLNAVMLYNALTGHPEVIKNNGSAVLYKVNPWVCTGAEMYAEISNLDTSHETYVLNSEDLKALTYERNTSMTYKTIEAKLVEITEASAVISSKLK